ncbi:YggT family protein [Brevundimonas sp. PAMC22021]|jgi:YggT family protein|uniref:YggT family protein n=1 Tax=Brevundimonas sp. PAMC22021 TaxID=2861285 RepID=UPI001C635C1E|nr:YggT family protein [Brevundimonas sp. PAMC22021]QYF86888.1 YggT family protein [Brevundimonas sp. PAMC22021]
MGEAIVWLVNAVITLLVWAIIGSAILSWLFAFDVINHRNRFVNQLATFLDTVTRPILEPFRRIIPPLGGIDISPIVVLLLLQFVRILFNNMAAPSLIMLLG